MRQVYRVLVFHMIRAKGKKVSLWSHRLTWRIVNSTKPAQWYKHAHSSSREGRPSLRSSTCWCLVHGKKESSNTAVTFLGMSTNSGFLGNMDVSVIILLCHWDSYSRWVSWVSDEYCVTRAIKQKYERRYKERVDLWFSEVKLLTAMGSHHVTIYT